MHWGLLHDSRETLRCLGTGLISPRLLTVQVQAIEALNEQRVLEGASRPLVVKFADSKRHMGPTSGQQPPQSGLMGHAGGRGGPSGGLKSGAGGDGDFQSPYWQMVNAQAGPHGAYPFQVRTYMTRSVL